MPLRNREHVFLEAARLAVGILTGKQEIVVTAAGIELPPISVRLRPKTGDEPTSIEELRENGAV